MWTVRRLWHQIKSTLISLLNFTRYWMVYNHARMKFLGSSFRIVLLWSFLLLLLMRYGVKLSILSYDIGLLHLGGSYWMAIEI